MKKIPITVAEGDGIGPEIMKAVLSILEASRAPLEIKKVEIGERVYLRGIPTGIEPSTWETIRASKAFLKAPITTPQGKGFKSLNVTVRTALGLFANVRPCVSYSPFVETKHPNMDVVIVRENEEDLYAGIEYRPTEEVYQAIKIITKPGCERIVRYAFEYARAHGRKKVTCFSKDNILKLTDGEFHKIFDRIGEEYPEIEKHHYIVDIGAARLADTPLLFDVIVMPNLYGDILSDVAAQIAGSVGLAGSANIGIHTAMFEAIHGSAPTKAGKNMANPSGLLLAAIEMLAHIGLSTEATLIHNAWLKTLEDGIHTYDIYKEKSSKKKVGTWEFAQAVIERFGQVPQTLPKAQYKHTKLNMEALLLKNHPKEKPEKKEIVGVDLFIDFTGSIKELFHKLKQIQVEGLDLKMIYNRGVEVWPMLQPETLCVDSWRCRYIGQHLSQKKVIELLSALDGISVKMTEMNLLFSFDGKSVFCGS